MKTLMFASTFCLVLRAQEAPQLISPQPNVGVWQAIQGDQRLHQYKAPAIVTYRGSASGLCSVPLVELHVDESIDARMAIKPSELATMPQANLPAPACGTSGKSEQIVVLKGHPHNPMIPLNDRLIPIIPPYIRLVPQPKP